MINQSLKNRLLFFLMFSSITSCGIFGQRNLAKRYSNNSRGIYKAARVSSSFANVELHSFTVIPSSPPKIVYNILSLSPQGQAEFIKSMAAKTTNKKQLAETLNASFDFSKSENGAVRIIPKTIKKSIVFTVNRPYYVNHHDTITFNMMGDRIAFLELSVNIADSLHAAFDSWDRFVTDLATLNLGKVTSAQSWNASLNLSAQGNLQSSLSGTNTDATGQTGDNNVVATNTQASPDGTISSTNATTTDAANSSSTNKSKTSGTTASAQVGGSANVSFTDNYQTAMDLNSRILKLSGTMSEKKIILRQESGPGLDLSGNTIVSIDYALDVDWAAPIQFVKFKEFYDTSKNPIEISHLKVSCLTVLFPDIQNDIVGTMDYSFLYRQINHGGKHLPEARQKVTFWYGDSTSPSIENIPVRDRIVLIKRTDVRPKGYYLWNGRDRLTFNGMAIEFETPQEAVNLLVYLGDLSRAGGRLAAFQTNSILITAATLPNLRIITENL